MTTTQNATLLAIIMPYLVGCLFTFIYLMEINDECKVDCKINGKKMFAIIIFWPIHAIKFLIIALIWSIFKPKGWLE